VCAVFLLPALCRCYEYNEL